MKTNSNRTQIEDLFLAAIDLPPDDRASFVDRTCDADTALRSEVLKLLQGHDWADEVVPEQGALPPEDLERIEAHKAAMARSLDIGRRFAERIGRYQVIRLLGEGGMGMVYLAEQENPKRLVALKVVRPGIATTKMIRRFEMESQVLGRLQHPGIAQIYEADTTDTGAGPQPYFVMEFVRGQPLLDYAKMRGYRTQERLELLTKICDAIQHAHRRGVIHRDLKPTNILVTDDGQPKILDFGVARVTDSDVQTTTLCTDVGQLVGTLPYMSPEQTLGDPVELDTRSDVYALGVIGYELLADRPPYDLSEKMIHEAVRVIREVPPTPLSMANRVFRGDLETIFSKALAKEPSRRYQSVSDLADDINHYLHDEPIEARPPSMGYQLRMFTRRHRATVAAVAAVTIVLFLGTIFSSIGFVQASSQRDQAEAARDVAQVATEQAMTDRDRAIVARQEARRQSYVANIIAAGAALSMNESRNVRRRLNAAPEEFRNWEWRYLNAEIDHSLAVLRGHEHIVMSVVFRPDGTRLASASFDKTVRVWDASTLKELTVLRGHEKGVRSVAFSPDGTRLASTSADKTVRLWDAATGKELLVLRGHEDEVNSVAFSPDGTHLASASYDKTVRLWDPTTGKELSVLRGHESSVWTVAFSPDGTRVASASGERMRQSDNSVRIWDASTGQELAVLRGHDSGVWFVVFSPDGSRLASTSYDKTVRLWDASDGAELVVLRGHRGFVTSAVFSLDGTRLASAGQDSTVRIWDTSTGEQLAVRRGLDDVVWSLALSPDGTRLVSASSDKTVRVWHAGMSEGEELSVLRGHEDAVFSVAFSPDGTRLASASGPLIEPEAYNDKQSDNTIRIWDLSTKEELAVLRGHEGSVSSVAFSPDGARLATGSADRTIRLWNASTGEELTVLRGHEDAVHEVVFSPDGTRLASVSGTWRGKTDNTVRIWDPSTAKELAVLRGHEDLVSSVAFSPDGNRLVSASLDKTVRLWDATTGEELAVLLGHQRSVTSISFSLDGRSVASGSLDGTVRLWDPSTGEEVRVLRAHELGVWSVAFSPDGKRLATGSADTTVRLWDTSSGVELCVLRGHKDAVLSLAFGPDGIRLASGSQDTTVLFWDTVSNADRYKERQAILAVGLDAEPMVDDLWTKLNDWNAIAQRLRDDDSLSEPLRRAALNAVLRKSSRLQSRAP